MAELLSNRKTLLEDCTLMRDILADTSKIDEECKKLTDELDSISVLIQKMIDENTVVAMSQDEYNEKYDGYAERYNRAKERYDKLMQRKTTLSFEVDIIECFMFEISREHLHPLLFQFLYIQGLSNHKKTIRQLINCINYRILFGVPKRIRTSDTRFRRAVLCPLSYRDMGWALADDASCERNPG